MLAPRDRLESLVSLLRKEVLGQLRVAFRAHKHTRSLT
jgi:hypothetical protein